MTDPYPRADPGPVPPTLSAAASAEPRPPGPPRPQGTPGPAWPGPAPEPAGPQAAADARWQRAPKVRHLDVDRPARLVYDAFWLTSVEDFDSPRVNETGAGLAIAAAALAELVEGGHIAIGPVGGGADHEVRPPDRPRPGPADSVGLSVLEAISAEPRPRSVRTWLEYLDVSGLATRVADHMVTHGLLHREAVTGRRGLRRRTRTVYAPVEPLVAGAAFYRLRKWLDDPDQDTTWADVWLLGMCEATGLDHIYRHRSEAAQHRSHELQQRMPAPWRALLLHLADAISSAATARGL